jgi:hypothetical protein
MVVTDKLKQKYTEYQLNKLRNHTPVFKLCPQCGESFDAQSYVFRPTAIYPRINEFCSQGCKKIGAGKKNKRIHKDYICEGCNNLFIPHKAKPHQKYCNHQCYTLSRKGKKRPEVQRWIHKITPPRGSVSKWEEKWLSQFNITHWQHHIKINDRTYIVDGYDERTETVYEFLGSFWHGNPAIYDPDDINPVCKRTFGDLYKQSMERLQMFRDHGYTVVYEWAAR